MKTKAFDKTDWRSRYQEAHREYQRVEYPSAYKDFGWIDTQFPDVNSTNGLTRAIEYFMNWNGGNMKRNNTMGRKIFDKRKNKEIWIKSASGRGGGDLKGTFNGKPVSLEIKWNGDTPSEHQLKEQERERRAGGVYEFIHNIDEFFEWFDMNVEIWKE